MTTDQKYMHRCIELARNGLGSTYPNPLVGSVIVYEDRIIGQGWHQQSGKPHAEVNAILDAEQSGYGEYAFAKAQLYVNLEPCSHTGKTPPCASLIIKKGFKKVIIGTLDPHDKVAGSGVALLRNHGITVTVNVLEEECNRLNQRFFTYHRLKRPFITLKWAETNDGFIAPAIKKRQKPVWISNAISRQFSHQLRAQEQAILVGAATVIDDNPSLTCRDWHGNNPTRIVVSSKELDSSLNVFNNDAPTLLINAIHHKVDNIVHEMYNNGIQSVIIEGGLKTIQAFIDHNIWDMAYQFIGDEVSFHKGIKAPLLPHNISLTEKKTIKNDTLNIYRRL